MRSFSVTAKRLQHARNFIEEPFSDFVSWIRNRLTQLVGGVQPDAVTLADFSSFPLSLPGMRPNGRSHRPRGTSGQVHCVVYARHGRELMG